MVRQDREAFLRRLERQNAAAGAAQPQQQEQTEQEQQDVADADADATAVDAPSTPASTAPTAAKRGAPAPVLAVDASSGLRPPDVDDVLRCLSAAGVLHLGGDAPEDDVDVSDLVDASSLELLRTYSPTPRLLRRRDEALSSAGSAGSAPAGVGDDAGGAAAGRPATAGPAPRRVFVFNSPGDERDSPKREDDGGAKDGGGGGGGTPTTGDDAAATTPPTAAAASSPGTPPPAEGESSSSSPPPPRPGPGHRTKKERRVVPSAATSAGGAPTRTDPDETERGRGRAAAAAAAAAAAELVELAAIADDPSRPAEERLLASMRRQGLALEALGARVDELTSALRRMGVGGDADADADTANTTAAPADRGPIGAEGGGGRGHHHRHRRGGLYGNFFPPADAAPPPPRPPRRSPLTVLTDAVDARARAAGNAIHDRLSHTRPYRVLRASLREARRQNVHANLDLWLLLRLIAVVAIFGGRASARRSASGYDPEGGFMATYRTQILFGAALLVYLFQTGIVGFVHRLVRDLPRLLREDDDEAGGRDGDGDGGGGGGGGEAAAEDRPPAGGDGVGAAAAGGEGQIRFPADANANANDGDRDGPAGAGGPPAGAAPPAGGPPPRRTLADGGVRRRRDDGGGVGRGLLNDVKYLVGGFVLSLVPTWRPVVDVEEEEIVEGEGGGAEGGGEAEGRGGGAGAGGGAGGGVAEGGGGAQAPGNADNDGGGVDRDGDDRVGGDGQ